MDINDILAQLRQGANIDDIAKDMTNALNEASRKYQEELEAEKAKREAELNETLKRADAAQIAVLLNKFAKNYYSDIPEEDFTADDLIKIYDCCATVLRNFQKVEEIVKPRVEKAAVATDDFTAAIDDFLDKFVR